MARIVLGMAVPHGEMLGKAPEIWTEEGARDHRSDGLSYRNRSWTYSELEKEHSSKGFKPLLAVEERRVRAECCWGARSPPARPSCSSAVSVPMISNALRKSASTHSSPEHRK